jgi:hypothetical protein
MAEISSSRDRHHGDDTLALARVSVNGVDLVFLPVVAVSCAHRHAAAVKNFTGKAW